MGSKADLKPTVQIKVDAAPVAITRRKKKEPSMDEGASLFDDAADGKSKVRDEFAEREKKKKEEEAKIIITPAVLPAKEEEEESEEEEEEEVKPKKKLSKADLKPTVQIKVDAAPVAITRRKKKEPSMD